MCKNHFMTLAELAAPVFTNMKFDEMVNEEHPGRSTTKDGAWK
jgi:hypothetical protein